MTYFEKNKSCTARSEIYFNHLSISTACMHLVLQNVYAVLGGAHLFIHLFIHLSRVSIRYPSRGSSGPHQQGRHHHVPDVKNYADKGGVLGQARLYHIRIEALSKTGKCSAAHESADGNVRANAPLSLFRNPFRPVSSVHGTHSSSTSANNILRRSSGLRRSCVPEGVRASSPQMSFNRCQLDCVTVPD